MKMIFLFSLGILQAGAAFAQSGTYNYAETLSSLGDFAAPVVSGTGDISNKQTGMILFDLSDGIFKGYDGQGNYQNFSAPAGYSNVSTSGAPESVNRAYFAGSTDASDCTSTPCTVHSQSGSWLASVARVSSTRYTLAITTGTFSGTPTCYCSGFSSTNVVACAQDWPNSTATSVPLTTGGASDARVQVFCMGPR